ncbi:glycoside-pentoside-hexuronide (GPH):cation symporter [Enterococcus dongliensis]|uniref:glycoside-pentoside-hexuronide (GPH):cation symporter n=2 Tax=Enterococcus dongliensis TaxID=2559925 RepID=UPI0028922DEC|nr:glycoside-pentoside-hexuronide (GPH):cation symporter [Enterococcus dongliensis]MDT2674656.1 glycoside-pentoside-hexuronide (GPH):cation symporter [Enterococcus dongliensis]
MQVIKIRGIEKFGFALTNLGNIPIMTLLNTYLLIFYTDVIGISPAVVGILFLCSRLLDGVSDPVLGFLIDRFPNTKFGKYKPILILGTIICCLNYLLVWFSPLLFLDQKIVAISVSYILLGITFDLMDIPLNSLIPVLTNRESERNVLSSIKGISYTVGPTILNIIAPLILARHNSKINGYIFLIVGTVFVVAFFTIIGTLTLRERVTTQVDCSKEIKKRYSIKDVLKILKIREVVTLFISMLFITAATNIFNGSLLYYLNYIIKDTRLLSLASFLGLFGALGAGILVPSLSKKFGKTRLYTFALLIISLAMIFLIFLENSRDIFLICYVMIQFGLGFTNTLQYSISANNVDIVRIKLGFESAGLIASLNSLIMKFGMAMGGAIPGFILSYTGYVANKEQVDSASIGIIIATFVIPLILYVLTIAIFNYGYEIFSSKSFSKENSSTSI